MRRLTGCAGILAVTLAVLGVAADAGADMKRLSAEFSYFGDEADTSTEPDDGGLGGTLIYSKTLFVPMRTLHITVSMTGDGHDGSQTLFSCLVDGSPCNPAGSDAGEGGWVTLQKHDDEDDFHDNSIYYTWCVNVAARNTYTVDVRMAQDGGDEVFIESAHFFIDNTTTGCGNKDVGAYPGTP